jgi:ribosomal protein S18 acetylase RimI-like enzyme
VAVHCEIVPFDEVREAPSGDLARLHEDLLPESPVVLLGERFMRDFYYRMLPRDGLIWGAAAYVNGRPAGFIVATDDSAGFMRRAVGRNMLRLAWLLGRSVLASPRRLVALWEAWRILRGVKVQHRGEGVGEILSFGVLPEFRDRAFVRETGLRISLDLFNFVAAGFRQKPAKLVRVVVNKDNREARFFYHGLGWELADPHVPGWRTASVEYLHRFDGREESAGGPTEG